MVELLTPRLTTRTLGPSLVLSAAEPAGAPARAVGEWLVRWAKDTPDTTFLAERSAGGADGADGAWITLSYAEVLRRVEILADALLAAGATPERPVMILSDNSIAVALVMLAAMHAGVPAAPVSSSYSLVSTTFERLGAVAQQLQPSVVFADDKERYAAALDAIARATLTAGTRKRAVVWSTVDLDVQRQSSDAWNVRAPGLVHAGVQGSGFALVAPPPSHAPSSTPWRGCLLPWVASSGGAHLLHLCRHALRCGVCGPPERQPTVLCLGRPAWQWVLWGR